ncbi:hypothetical protein [Arthrobacter sp. Soil736]|nr:hypothetical protein [Arthrobacter sp. Soil736]
MCQVLSHPEHDRLADHAGARDDQQKLRGASISYVDDLIANLL